MGYGCNGSKNAVLCQHITGPRRRAGKDDPIAAEEKKHEGTGSAGGSVHGADSGAAALAVETAAGTPPAVTEAPYSDVPAEAWYAPFAADLKQDGAVSGYEDGTFRPDNAVTVGEALVMVLAAAGFDRREATGEHWSSGNADFALEKGFVTREQVTDLDSAVSRLTVAQMAAKALNLRPSRNETPFGDVDDGYVTVLYEKIQLSGELEEDGTLSYHPEDSITRSELVAIIWRMKNTDVHAGQIAYEGYSQTFYLDVLETVPAFSYIPQLFRMEGDYLTYDDGTVQGHLGVDVSQFQGEIDWEQAADAGVEFAIVRVAAGATPRASSMRIHTLTGTSRARWMPGWRWGPTSSPRPLPWRRRWRRRSSSWSGSETMT